MVGKIALGVFFGVIAAYLVVTFSGEAFRAIRPSYADKHSFVLTGLTPERLAASCGAPKSDTQKEIAPGTLIRTIEYGDYDFTFARADKDWVVHFQRKGSDRMLSDDDAVFAMPCLKKL